MLCDVARTDYLLAFAQERRAAGVMETLRGRLQVSARVLRDANWQVVPARDVVPGDIVRVRPHSPLPARPLVFALFGDLHRAEQRQA